MSRPLHLWAHGDVLRDVASWLDEEHRLNSMVPSDGQPRSEASIALGERRAVLGELAALMRQWADTGKEPAHRSVKEQWRLDYQRRGRR